MADMLGFTASWGRDGDFEGTLADAGAFPLFIKGSTGLRRDRKARF